MYTLISKMETELNRLAQEKQDIYRLAPPTQIEQIAEIQKKQTKLRALLARYSAIHNEFLELTGALSIY